MLKLITYDLNSPGQDYNNLYGAIKNVGTWWHYLNNIWIINTILTAKQISDRLNPLIDKNDHIFIVSINKDYAGWLPRNAWNWLNSN